MKRRREKRLSSRTTLTGTALLVALVSLSGCYPVGTLIGRSAAVVAPERTERRYGLGITCPADGADIMGEFEAITYSNASWTTGLGTGWDFQAGVNNLFQVYADVRGQFAGLPRGERAEDVRGIDASFDAGGAAEVFLDNTCVVDGHLGVNVSFDLGETTPYLAYRHHWASRRDVSSTPPTMPFLVDTVYAGFEFPAGSLGKSWALEFFYSWISPAFDGNAALWGINLVGEY